MAEPTETTTDAFLGGRVTLVQPRSGHRAGLDAALLQAAVPDGAKGACADLGSGVGPVALAVAARLPGMKVTGLERDGHLVGLAREALALAANAALSDRVRILEFEIGAAAPAESRAALGTGSFDWVLANPPFDDPGRVSLSPHGGKRSAYLAETGTLPRWTDFALALLRQGGHLAIIHRAEALPAVLAALAPGFGDVQVLPVHPRADAAAKRILVRATGGRRTRMRLLPPLVLHPPAHLASHGARMTWTEAAAALLSGEAHVNWL